MDSIGFRDIINDIPTKKRDSNGKEMECEMNTSLYRSRSVTASNTSTRHVLSTSKQLQTLYVIFSACSF